MTQVFDKLWGKCDLTDEDLREFQNVLLKNPLAGDIIKETGGARKIRFALPSTGKGGGIRIIYVDLTHLQQTYLILCYPKSGQDDLTTEQKKQVKALIKALKEV
jgi:hypothetical protein